MNDSAVKQFEESFRAALERQAVGGLLAVDEGLYIETINRLFGSLRTSESGVAGLIALNPRATGRVMPSLWRSELGVIPRSLLEAFGLFDQVLDLILPEITPICKKCRVGAVAPQLFARLTLPSDGYLALVVAVADQDDGITLSERCEMLGLRRVVVNQRLALIEDCSGQRGEPVLMVDQAKNRSRLAEESERWFARGGGALKVVRLDSRDGLVEGCATLSARWRCAKCEDEFAPVTRAALREVESCQVCAGKGWLVAPDWQRWIECRECRGFGSLSEVRGYTVQGVALGDLMTLSFRELGKLLVGSGRAGSEVLSRALGIVISSPFADYPLASSVELLSRGELALASVVIGELSRLSSVRYLVDRAVAELGKPTSALSNLTILAPQVSQGAGLDRFAPASRRNVSGAQVVLSDLELGPLSIDRISFPRQALTAIEGEAGVGKSLLISTIATLFSKRNKFKHRAEFGNLKRCELIDGLPEDAGVVLDLLGLGRELAQEVARSRAANLAGVLEGDLVGLRAKYRCAECAGGGVLNSSLDPCEACQGAVFDWRVTSLPVADRSFGDLLVTPLGDLSGALFYSDLLQAICKGIPEWYRKRLTLATPVVKLSLEERRFLALWGGLQGIIARARQGSGLSLERELVLIDGPRVISVTHRNLIAGLLTDLRSYGATIAYASIPEGLESGCDCVLSLSPRPEPKGRLERSSSMDTRYARVCVASVKLSGE